MHCKQVIGGRLGHEILRLELNHNLAGVVSPTQQLPFGEAGLLAFGGMGVADGFPGGGAFHFVTGDAAHARPPLDGPVLSMPSPAART